MCLLIFPYCFGFVGVSNCGEALGSVPRTVIAHVCAEGGEASAVSVLGGTWKWYGVMVPVIRDFWSKHVLVTSMFFLLWKHGRGNSVGLRVSPCGENLMLRRLMYGFGISHIVL